MQRHLTLFAEHAQISAGSHLLISQIDDADFLADLSQRYTLDIFHRDYAAIERLRTILANRPRITLHNRALPDVAQKYDAAFVQIPKSRGFSQATLFTHSQIFENRRPLIRHWCHPRRREHRSNRCDPIKPNPNARESRPVSPFCYPSRRSTRSTRSMERPLAISMDRCANRGTHISRNEPARDFFMERT